jgi:hypothetical protein
MAKTNFTKVEGLLEDSIVKKKVEKWGKMADIAQSVQRPEMRKLVESANEAAEKIAIDKKALLHALVRAKKDFKGPKFYEAIGISSEELDALLSNPKELKPEDWQRLQEIRVKVADFKKKDIEEHIKESGDDAIVTGERRKHINKRFNINEKWLPLK